jgi:hypothetical protein
VTKFYNIAPQNGNDIYVGQWKDNLYDGQGKLVAATYNYEGHWKDNQMSGNGLLVSFHHLQYICM